MNPSLCFEINIIILAKDNFDELSYTLDTCCSQAVPSHFTIKIFIIDSSLDYQNVQDIASRAQIRNPKIDISSTSLFPPPGIYNSMNVALQRSQSDALIFMNSGDSFYDTNSLFALASTLQSARLSGVNSVCAFGQTQFQAYNGKLRWISPWVSVGRICYWLKFYYPCHQAVLFDTSWAKHHPYNSLLGITADSQIIRTALNESKLTLYVPNPVACFSLNGQSSKPPKLKELFSSSDFKGMEFKRQLIRFIMSPSSLPNLLPLYAFVRHAIICTLIRVTPSAVNYR